MTITDFRGAAQALTDAGMSAACRVMQVTPVDVWTVLAVETKGTGYLDDGRPRILFERHKFSQRTGHRYDEMHPDISNRHPGGYVGGAGEYHRLQDAMALDRRAALESASWGIGQVMGFNAGLVGCSSVEILVTQAMTSEDEQIMHMARFICACGLDSALQRHDWAAFARGYNGADYAKNKYDAKLRQQHAKWSAGPLPDIKVRADQIRLSRKGLYTGPIDGDRGRLTRAAEAAEGGKAAA